ncbi:poly-gamma-glutamate hydrolase family protein [Oceanobacillus senegalensis]|uniref:poly-gamma-glutamate hydrolase family protein n=1 Tax=Oceanobacillus senegalensis TaxID=1936063 RepID=UPI001C5007F2|nr:poly-gamma-glutamate hydrolase family protein [Oceanobacillus senegalensis]
MDLYSNYEELSQNEVEGVDYAIRTYLSKSSLCSAIAIHGGGIEPGTSELVRELCARFWFVGYEFDAMKSRNNKDLHITATNFDEPKALDIVSKTFHTLSIHGYSEDERNTYIGGLDKSMIHIVKEELTKAGFHVDINPPEPINGNSLENICNKNRRRQGIQLEISTGQRRNFFANGDLSRLNRENPVQDFYDYVNALGNAMKRC